MDKLDTFDEMFPEGLNRTIASFEKAVYEIMTTEEIDRVINCAGEEEKEELINFKKEYLECAEEEGFKWYHFHWIVSMQVKSASLLRDIIAYMVMNDTERYTEGEENDNA